MNQSRARLLRSLNGDGRYGAALAGAIGLCALLAGGGAPWRLLLRYDRAGLAEGQYWRLLSAHFVHLDVHHLVLNMSGLVLLWIMFARTYRLGEWLLVALLAIGAIDAGLWWGSPQVSWYVGASGLLHGVWMAGVCGAWWRGERFGAVLALVLAGKLAYEHYLGPSPLAAGLPVVSIAHVYGALGGAVAALALAPARRRL